jgi:hypothetical protein
MGIYPLPAPVIDVRERPVCYFVNGPTYARCMPAAAAVALVNFCPAGTFLARDDVIRNLLHDDSPEEIRSLNSSGYTAP